MDIDLTTSPFRRLREMTGLNAIKFTEAASISRTTTTYLEAGLYTVIPPRPLATLAHLLSERLIDPTEVLSAEYGNGDIEVATIIWQRAVRQTLKDRIREAWKQYESTEFNDIVTPVEEFARLAFGNQDAFCKAMKVATGPVYLYRDSDSRPMPLALKTALLDAGLTPREVQGLADDMEEWRKDHARGAELADA